MYTRSLLRIKIQNSFRGYYKLNQNYYQLMQSPPVSAAVDKIKNDQNNTNNNQCMNHRWGEMKREQPEQPKDNQYQPDDQ